MAWFILWIIIGILLCDLLVHLICSRLILRFFRKEPAFEIAATTPDDCAENVTFTTSDGLTLHGSWYRHVEEHPRGVIVFCHEFMGNRWLAMSYCEGLWEAGYDIFTFDYRNHGDSEVMHSYQPIHWLTDYELDDTLSAIRYVNSQLVNSDLPIGIFGISRGATAALATAARVPAIQHVVADGAFSIDTLAVRYVYQWGRLFFPDWLIALAPRWHILLTLRLVRYISQKQFRCRYVMLERCLSVLRNKAVLLIAGECDSYVPPGISKELAKQIEPDGDLVWIAPNAKHNGARRVNRMAYDQKLLSQFTSMQGSQPVILDQLEKIAFPTG